MVFVGVAFQFSRGLARGRFRGSKKQTRLRSRLLAFGYWPLAIGPWRRIFFEELSGAVVVFGVV